MREHRHQAQALATRDALEEGPPLVMAARVSPVEEEATTGKLSEAGDFWQPADTCLPQSRRLWCLLGLSAERECWGIRAHDTESCLCKKGARKRWFETPGVSHGHGHEQADTWSTVPWYEAPHLRHHWGEPQEPLHTGAGDLFLDLIFVGVAYRVGIVMKAAFYSCEPTSSSGYGSYGYGYGYGGNTTRRRELAPSGANQPECVGLGLGLAYALAPFMCMYMIWSIEREYKASYACRSKVHYALELLNSLALVVASMSIDTVASYRGVLGATALMLTLGALVFSLFVWILRLTEVALSSEYEAPRRQSSALVVLGLQVLACWLGGWALIVVPVQSAQEAAMRADICVGLMWLGALRWRWQQFASPLRLLLVPGARPIIERAFVISNMGFQFHRNNEFMFLMLGETVLQTVVATAGRSDAEGVQERTMLGLTKLTAIMSFLIAVEMMYCFRSMVAHQITFYQGNNTRMAEDYAEEEKLLADFKASRHRTGDQGVSAKARFAALVKQQQARSAMTTRQAKVAEYEHLAQPLLLTAKVWTAVEMTIWQTMAIAVMLVGVGVKLAIYDPLADARAHFALQFRFVVGAALTVVFMLQLLFSMLIRRRQFYRHPWRLMRTQPAHCLLVGLQVTALVSQTLIALIPMVPAATVAAQALVGLIQCILLHVRDAPPEGLDDSIAHAPLGSKAHSPPPERASLIGQAPRSHPPRLNSTTGRLAGDRTHPHQPCERVSCLARCVHRCTSTS